MLHRFSCVTDNEAKLDALLGAALHFSPLHAHLGPGPLRRERLTLWRTKIETAVFHPGGGIGQFGDVVVCMTAQRAYMIHVGYRHGRSRVRLTLKTHWKSTMELLGTVSACEHLSQNVHVSEVTLEEPAELSCFIRGYRPPVVQETPRPAVPAALSGRVMIVDDIELQARLLGVKLECTSFKIETQTSLPRALDRLSTQYFHLVICDAHVEPGSGEGVVKRLRDAGHKGGVVLTMSDAKRLRDADAAVPGSVRVLPKPVELEELLMAAAEVLPVQSASMPAEVRSELERDPSIAELLPAYADSLREKAESIQASIEKRDFETARAMCEFMKETGSGFGFRTITEAAAEAIKALDSSMAINESLLELETLLEFTRRVAVRVPEMTM